MRGVIQRVLQASVSVDGEEKGRIHRGLLLFLGIGMGDTTEDADWLIKKISQLRVLDRDPHACSIGDASLLDLTDCNTLVISQFTLYGSLKKGNRPSYSHAAPPDEARSLYDYFLNSLQEKLQRPVAAGVFGADMRIEATHDGPLTLIVDTRCRDA